MPSVPSISCVATPAPPPSHGASSLPVMPPLRNSQSFDSSSGLIRLQSSSKTLTFLSINESSAPNSIFGFLIRDQFFTSSSCSVSVLSSLSRPAQPAGPECRKLPHHPTTPDKSHGLREPHGAARTPLQLPDHLRQPELHLQWCRAASAPQTQQQFTSTGPESWRQPAGCTAQFPSSPGLLRWNKWASTFEQNRTAHPQVERKKTETSNFKVARCTTNYKFSQISHLFLVKY